MKLPAVEQLPLNLIAGLQLAFSDAIRLDDAVVVDGEWGRIEELTLTYVVVRLWDERRLILPVSYFTSTPFENWTRSESRVVGHILLYKRPHDLRVPADSIDLAAASTFPEAHGSGAGLALTEHVLHWAHEHGYPTMTTDWRMTNLLASRFWPKRGFRRTFLRLYRALP